jgi:hypothetical protein
VDRGIWRIILEKYCESYCYNCSHKFDRISNIHEDQKTYKSAKTKDVIVDSDVETDRFLIAG